MSTQEMLGEVIYLFSKMTEIGDDTVVQFYCDDEKFELPIQKALDCLYNDVIYFEEFTLTDTDSIEVVNY